MFRLPQLVAILSVALHLVPGGAYLFEMPNKLSLLAPGSYMVGADCFRRDLAR